MIEKMVSAAESLYDSQALPTDTTTSGYDGNTMGNGFDDDSKHDNVGIYVDDEDVLKQPMIGNGQASASIAESLYDQEEDLYSVQEETTQGPDKEMTNGSGTGGGHIGDV